MRHSIKRKIILSLPWFHNVSYFAWYQSQKEGKYINTLVNLMFGFLYSTSPSNIPTQKAATLHQGVMYTLFQNAPPSDFMLHENEKYLNSTCDKRLRNSTH